MAIAGGHIQLDSTEGMDRITQTEKVTSPYFSNGTSILTGAHSASNLTATNEKYFFGIANSATTTTEEFNVAFGSTNGYGANVEASTKSETAVVYGQYANLLLAPTEVTGGFHISSPASDSVIASGKDEEIFVMSARRSNMKDRLNKGSWTAAFSGSLADGSGKTLKLTDDSSTTDPTATPVGDRYNIISGAAGTAHAAASSSTAKNYGFFYPNTGIMVYSAAELSASIPGGDIIGPSATVFASGSQLGFGYLKNTTVDSSPGLLFINALHTGSDADAGLTFRDEEDQVSAQYFCRVRSGQMNFSNNPTFVSGSLNELRHTTMKGNPTVFITSVQLYNSSGHMVAVGNLSTPIKKNFSSEATIKVQLTY